MRLVGPRVILRPATPDDLEPVAEIRNEPDAVARWAAPEPGELERFLAEVTTFVIEVAGEPIGAIAYHEETDPMYRHAGIDLFVSAGWHNRGFGSEAVWVLARHLIRDRGHHRLTIDPAADHGAAIRAYGKVGFRPVGVMRAYELGPEGWHDGLLMDLLADDLVDPDAGQAGGGPTEPGAD